LQEETNKSCTSDILNLISTYILYDKMLMTNSLVIDINHQ